MGQAMTVRDISGLLRQSIHLVLVTKGQEAGQGDRYNYLGLSGCLEVFLLDHGRKCLERTGFSSQLTALCP